MTRLPCYRYMVFLITIWNGFGWNETKSFGFQEKKNVHYFRLQIFLGKLNISQGFSNVVVPSPGYQFTYPSAVPFKNLSVRSATGTRAITNSDVLPPAFLQVKSCWQCLHSWGGQGDPPPQSSRAGPCASGSLHGPLSIPSTDPGSSTAQLSARSQVDGETCPF